MNIIIDNGVPITLDTEIDTLTIEATMNIPPSSMITIQLHSYELFKNIKSQLKIRESHIIEIIKKDIHRIFSNCALKEVRQCPF
jgi:hypothetical protein